jgi:hypothetical protein
MLAASEARDRGARGTTGWSGVKRQQAIVDELSKGNLPSFLRQLKPDLQTWTPSHSQPPWVLRPETEIRLGSKTLVQDESDCLSGW